MGAMDKFLYSRIALRGVGADVEATHRNLFKAIYSVGARFK